jgi:hypothetical protein
MCAECGCMMTDKKAPGYGKGKKKAAKKAAKKKKK